MGRTLQRRATARECPGSLSEESLVAAIRSGDAAAAEYLVRTHAPWMLAVARRITSDVATAEDCVQDALVKSLKGMEEFEGRSSIKSWLHRIVVNQALMKLRQRNRRREDSIDDWLPVFDEHGSRIAEPRQGTATPEEIYDEASRRAFIRAKIDQLPESYRIVLRLRDIEDMTTAEVAAVTGLSENNVKVRLHRARSALKALLEPVLKGDI